MSAKVKESRGGVAELSLPAEAVERAGLKAGDELSVFAPGGHLVLLTGKGASRGYFAGSLSSITIAEVFGFICSALRTGTLVVQAPSARKSVSFLDGRICAASSTDPSERLGPVLWRCGLLTLEQLREVEPLVKPGLRLGQILTDRKVLTAAHRYKGMQMQVKEIVLGLFSHAEGEFAFVEAEAPEANAVKLEERTRDVVFLGMSRADELEKLRRELAAGAVLAPGKAPAGLDAPAQAVLELVDGKRKASDLMRESRLGEYHTRKALSGLLKSGAVQMAQKREAPKAEALGPAQAGPVQSPVETYAEIVSRIAEVMAQHGLSPTELNIFFRHPPRRLDKVFAGVEVSEGGSIDLAAVLANAAKEYPEPKGRIFALEALDDFLAFALFEIKNALPPQVAVSLAAEVRRRQKGQA